MEKEYVCLDENNYAVNIVILSENNEEDINNLKSAYGYSQVLSCEEVGKPNMHNILENGIWIDNPDQVLDKQESLIKVEEDALKIQTKAALLERLNITEEEARLLLS
jgi:hypothetical protein